MLEKVLNIVKMNFDFEKFEDVGSYFRTVINSLKQMNYSEFQSDQFHRYEDELESLIGEKKVA
jgi:V/A-type H+-transporting ATPase subunit A